MRPQVRGVPLTECRDCADPIRFVHLNTGTSIPVNPGAGDGPIAARKIARDLHGYYISKDRPLQSGFLRFTPHAATCTERARTAPPTEAPDDPALF